MATTKQPCLGPGFTVQFTRALDLDKQGNITTNGRLTKLTAGVYATEGVRRGTIKQIVISAADIAMAPL